MLFPMYKMVLSKWYSSPVSDPSIVGAFPFGTPATQRKSQNSTMVGIGSIPSIQLLGIEMLLHFFMGPEVLAFAKEKKVVFSLGNNSA